MANTAKIASKEIKLDRIFYNHADLRGAISGRGTTDIAILTFKELLASEERIANVNLPLSNIKPEPDKSASFSLMVTLKGEQ